ncbi:MAG: hypothetical protein L3J52_04845 [Proteobacteria bacterium]|nr:hypothetical protein [Pseudomonadota bacterium]
MTDTEKIMEMWQTHNQKLENSIRLNTEVLNRLKLNSIKNKLRKSLVLPLLNGLIFGWLYLWLLNYMGELESNAGLFVAGIVLSNYLLANVLINLFILINFLNIDYGKPVLQIRKKLLQLKSFKLSSTKYLILLNPIIWMPVQLILFDVFFDINLYQPSWLWINIGVSVTAMIILYFLMKKYTGKLSEQTIRDETGWFLSDALDDLTQIDKEQLK